jgi:dihydrofolate synthase/folylpolyglutamate synthase
MARTLSDWLTLLEQRAPESQMELGLDRVATVLARLQLDLHGIPIITVTGTNGKGSTVAMLEAIYRAAGWRTFAYRSPHITDFGERMQLAGQPADPSEVVLAFEAVEQARAEIRLTWFEQVTLAAWVVAARARPDVMLLEVGLGGRLDAVNVLDTDVAVITSIGLDHADWLGRTRRAVLTEKLGIARPQRPLIIGERRLPEGADALLKASDAVVQCAGREFRWRKTRQGMRLQVGDQVVALPKPGLQGDFQLGNAACAWLAVQALQARLPVPAAAVEYGLRSVRLPGRLQQVGVKPFRLVDVAHNPAAARALSGALGPWPAGRTVAVFSALADKNVAAIGQAMDRCVDHWLVAGLSGPRGQSAARIAEQLQTIPVRGRVDQLESLSEAWQHALASSRESDRIVAFGSFRVLTELADQWTDPSIDPTRVADT